MEMRFDRELFVEPVNDSVQFEKIEDRLENLMVNDIFHRWCHSLLNNRKSVNILLQASQGEN